ncbi:MAG: ion transporter [Microcoleaceae cyanobacterium]
MQTFRPNSKQVTAWESLIVLITLYNYIVIPFRIAFRGGSSNLWITLDYLTDFILIIDIFLRFYIGYIDRGEMVTDKVKIQQHYFSKDFKLYLLASFPLDLIFRLIFPTSSIRSLRLLGILRIPRLLRGLHCLEIFREWENNISINPAVIRMLQLLLLIFLIDHWVACIWYLIGSIAVANAQISWLTNSGLENVLPRTKYLHSLYWSITTLTTVGYGDITPENDVEIIFSLMVMFLGVAIYAFIIGNVASIMSSLNASQNHFREKLDQIQSYMRERRIPRYLQKEVRNYYQYLWRCNRDVSSELNFLDELPHSLKTNLYLHLYRDLVEEVPLFQEAEPNFIRDLVNKLQPIVLPPDECVIREGEIGHEMYFISKGELEAFSQEGDKVTIYRTMSAGYFFGEIALLCTTERTASVKTLTYCELFRLDQDDFTKVLSKYPEARQKISAIAQQRYGQ